MKNIKTINNYDNHSDFFRYPTSRDKAKDSHKQISKKITLEEALINNTKSKTILLAIENNLGNITSLYSTQNSPIIEDIAQILDDIACHFDCFHTALRITMFNNL